MMNIQIVGRRKLMVHRSIREHIMEHMNIKVQHKIKLMELLVLQHYSLRGMHMILVQHTNFF